MLIGQRGNDELDTGSGMDVAIGDAGMNTVTTTMDLPRIYQIYRSFESPKNSGYSPGSSRFGYLFGSDFDLVPKPYRSIDSGGMSIIDQ